MYAIVQTGGKQYKVSPGDKFDVEKLSAQPGDEVILAQVLLLGNDKETKVGQPFLENVSVPCNIIGQVKGKKVISFTYRRRKDSKRKVGHRQLITRLEVKEIKRLKPDYNERGKGF